jgi:NADPH:quinone reductase-like Zn-dependent oxidoreductase
MRAIVIEEFGGVEKLELENVDDPEVGAGEVLVRVRATSVNPVDWKIRSGASKGRFDVELPAILGRDLAGEVERAGEGVIGFAKGQRVMAMANGTYAELMTAKADVLAPIPDNLSFERAAALPLVVLTGAQLIERAVKVERGQTVLILGALGGVGRSAAYVALQHGAKVIAGVRGSQTGEAEEVLHVQQVVAADDQKELEKLHDLDAVADTVGGTVAARGLKTLKVGGVFGSVLGAPRDAAKYKVRTAVYMSQPDASRLYELADDVAQGHFSIPIAKTLPLDQIREAHREAEEGHLHGKIVLRAA